MPLRAFLRETRATFETTGAVAPSSQALARALAEPLREDRTEGPRRVLEAGPGTGAVTRAILPLLRAGDELVLCEVNPRFAEMLRTLAAEDPAFRACPAEVQVVEGRVETLESGGAAFHHVICGIPFNNFPRPVVESIFGTFARVIRRGGTLAYFEYAALRRLKTPFVSRPERERLRELSEFFAHELGMREFRRRLVLWNVPPAWARHLRY